MGIDVIGTGHILEKSVREVKKKIEEKKPDMVALELDRDRFHELKRRFYSKKKDRGNWWNLIKEGGGSFLVLGFLLEKIQERLGRNLGVSPGSEMIQAIKSAKKDGSEVILIDRDIRVTMNHFFRIPFKEKKKLLNLKMFDWKVRGMPPITNLDELLEEKSNNPKVKNCCH